MKSIYQISFSLMVCMFIALFAGQNISECYNEEKCKTEDTSNIPASCTHCNSEYSSEADVSLFIQSNSDQFFNTECNKLVLQALRLPPCPYYSIWLPPDNS